MRKLTDLLAGLPPEADEQALLPQLQAAVRRDGRPVVVVDDDPTGVQTVYDTPVLLEPSADDLRSAMAEGGGRLLFVLTNSRSLPLSEAEVVNQRLGEQLTQGSGGAPFVAISRSDSTLRGHYPGEMLALAAGMGSAFDGHLLVPAFFEGGRYTIDDSHWVATPTATSSEVIAASETPFAKDPAFGFRSSHLPTWVEEKSSGRWQASDVRSIPQEVVRQGPEAVRDLLLSVTGGVPVVVNAAGYGDLANVVLGLLMAEAQGKRFLYRTAASFVRVRAGLAPRAPMTASEVHEACGAGGEGSGGLVVAGSYVPATGRQLEALLGASDLPVEGVELGVQDVLTGAFSAEATALRVDELLRAGRVAVLYTSRAIVHGEDAAESLRIGSAVMAALVGTVAAIRQRPRFVIAKGGITSHQVASMGIGARRALALGQLLPGVPVWRLEDGAREELRGTPYVVFPGNVGDDGSLANAARILLA